MGVIEASGFARKGVPMTGKQSAAEWLRGIVEESYRAEAYPSCAGIARTFFGLECPDARQHGSCILMMLTAIADRIDAERALPEGIEWPRFEDGELVKVGDTVGSDEPFTAEEIAFESDRWLVKASSRSVCGCFHGAFGEPVKRPTRKVLDADGAPINVGDAVYFVGGSGVRYAVKDIDFELDGAFVDIVDEEGRYSTMVNPECLTHESPDSWRAWGEDLDMAVKVGEVDKVEMMRRAKALAQAGEQG